MKALLIKSMLAIAINLAATRQQVTGVFDRQIFYKFTDDFG
jgi:hypothetical protein